MSVHRSNCSHCTRNATQRPGGALAHGDVGPFVGLAGTVSPTIAVDVPCIALLAGRDRSTGSEDGAGQLSVALPGAQKSTPDSRGDCVSSSATLPMQFSTGIARRMFLLTAQPPAVAGFEGGISRYLSCISAREGSVFSQESLVTARYWSLSTSLSARAHECPVSPRNTGHSPRESLVSPRRSGFSCRDTGDSSRKKVLFPRECPDVRRDSTFFLRTSALLPCSSGVARASVQMYGVHRFSLRARECCLREIRWYDAKNSTSFGVTTRGGGAIECAGTAIGVMVQFEMNPFEVRRRWFDPLRSLTMTGRPEGSRRRLNHGSRCHLDRALRASTDHGEEQQIEIEDRGCASRTMAPHHERNSNQTATAIGAAHGTIRSDRGMAVWDRCVRRSARVMFRSARQFASSVLAAVCLAHVGPQAGQDRAQACSSKHPDGYREVPF
jgi:hypothetical protein